MKPVQPSQVGSLRELLARESTLNLKLLGTLDEEGGSCEAWWFDRWPNPRGTLCRRRTFYSLYAVNDEGARTLLEEIDWSNEVGFSGLPARFMPLVREMSVPQSENPCWMYFTTKEDFRPWREEEVSPLRPEDAPRVAANWRYGQDEPYVLSRILSGPTQGVRIDGQLVSWALTHGDGSIGMVHTLPPYRGRHLARRAVSALTKGRLREGKTPWCFIVQGNLASVRVFEALGFRRAGDYYWVGAARRPP